MTERAVAELTDQRINILEAIRGAVDSVDIIPDSALGPRDYTSIDYPYAQVLPESSDYQGGTDYDHLIRCNFIFEREREVTGDQDTYLKFMQAALEATKRSVVNCLDQECVQFAMPTTIEDFAGEVEGSLLIMISVQLTVRSSVHFTE